MRSKEFRARVYGPVGDEPRRSAQSIEGFAVGSGQPGLGARIDSEAKRASRRTRSGAPRPRPKAGSGGPCASQDQSPRREPARSSSAFCSPVEQASAGWSLGAWTTKIAWGPHRRADQRRARARRPAPSAAGLGGERRASRPASPRPRRSWRPARPKRSAGVAAGGVRRPPRVGPGAGDGDAALRQSFLEVSIQARSRWAVRTLKPERARAPSARRPCTRPACWASRP